MSAVAELPDTGWLKDGALARLLSLLDRDGEEARVVGGAVRNALIRLPFDEVDIATTAVPDEVTRRDFTINALSVSADGKIHDYVGGLADIAAHKVRFIGEPAQRIAEDYLRILRFFRFHAWYAHGPPDAAGLHACVVARAGLETLSRERVRMELMKLLVAPRATPTLAVMAETGILGTVLGGVPLLASFENMAKVEAAIGAPADAVQRLGALGVATTEDAERLSERLRLSNAEFERLMALECWWRVKPAAGEHAARVLLYQLGTKSFVDRALVAWSRSDAGAADAAWRQRRHRGDRRTRGAGQQDFGLVARQTRCCRR